MNCKGKENRHEILKERQKSRKKPKTFCFCTPMVIIKSVDAGNKSMHFLKKLNVVTCPSIYEQTQIQENIWKLVL